MPALPIIKALTVARGFLKSLPWQVYVAAAFIALLPLSYCKGRSDGKSAVYKEFEARAAKADKKAYKAAMSADKDQRKAAMEFEAEQKVLQDAIDDAKSNDANALDALF